MVAAQTPVQLPPRERAVFEMLRAAMPEPVDALDLMDLIEEIWGQRENRHLVNLRVLVQRLRNRLNPIDEDAIVTVRSYGYRLTRDVQVSRREWSRTRNMASPAASQSLRGDDSAAGTHEAREDA